MKLVKEYSYQSNESKSKMLKMENLLETNLKRRREELRRFIDETSPEATGQQLEIMQQELTVATFRLRELEDEQKKLDAEMKVKKEQV